MSKAVLKELFVLVTEQGLQRNAPGASEPWMPTLLSAWTLCYLEASPGNPFHRDPRVLDMIRRVGDRLTVLEEFHVTRSYGWLDTLRRLAAELDAPRQAAWRAKLIADAQAFVERWCRDLRLFDGNVPNSVTWTYAYVYRVGQTFGNQALMETAVLAMERQMGSQTPDGCFREFQTQALMAGTPVTHYNRVTAMAVEAYYAASGDSRAEAVLDKAWHWFYDWLLPDYTTPPTLDHRCTYQRAPNLELPAWFINQPEGRYIAMQCWHEMRADLRREFPGRHFIHSFGMLALLYDLIREDVSPHRPTWPESRRMLAEPACIRRRHGWAAVLSGMTNYQASQFAVRLFSQERQDCVNVFHEKLGLLIGSSHSKIDPNFSSFVFFENGAAHYLPNHAYVKSTPALDTLLLRYGTNIGALSVDLTQPERAAIVFSLHGELGQWAKRGEGHPLTAIAARVHLLLRLKDGDRVACSGKTWTLGDAPIVARVPAGADMDFGGWRLGSPDCPWEFRWPQWGVDPYTALEPDSREKMAGVEAVLLTSPVSRPTATFHVKLADG